MKENIDHKISLIICSWKKELPVEFLTNVSQTIGVEYEIVHVYNDNSQYSLYEALNIGQNRAKYPYLCFLHDDILHYTENWGNIIISYFEENKNWGLITVAGCKILRETPSFWSIPEYNAFNMIQSDKSGKMEKQYWQNIAKQEEIIAFDAMWFCTRKSIFEKVRFDQDTFSGFNTLDLDIAMQIHSLGLKLYVVPDILLEHFSLGSFDKMLVKNTLAFYKKWRTQLPVLTVELEKQTLKKLEFRAFKSFLKLIIHNKVYIYIPKFILMSLMVRLRKI